jgi:hypothetical protein
LKLFIFFFQKIKCENVILCVLNVSIKIFKHIKNTKNKHIWESEKLPDLDLSSCRSWWSLSVRPWIVSTKLCDFGSGVKHCKFTILFIFGMDPFECTWIYDKSNQKSIIKIELSGERKRKRKSARKNIN